MVEMTSGRVSCGDCSAPNPEWASMNRGLLLCNDCCFIHRSLGPQYSIIKSLKDGDWTLSLGAMIMTLAGGPANHVWEHLLLDRSKAERDTGIKKPFPYDTLEVKRKFIQLKHFQFQFVLRPAVDQIEVKSQELHSTVRTASVDTTLRLLAGGGDPNYFHPEKGTRPMHVAARNGQAAQVELLHLHGANSAAPDYLGQTPMDHAIAAGHRDLALRLQQLRYSLTDQLTFFVCQKLPDHVSTKHIIVPSIKDKSPKHEADISNLASYLLEQLAADLLDEVGRRQIERVVQQKFGAESPKFSIAFLPVNPHYPSVRNQARQKFARLTDTELCSMISLVLSETEKRHRRSGGISPDLPSATSETESIFRRLSVSSSTAAINGNGQQKIVPAAGAASKSGLPPPPPPPPLLGAMALLDDDDYPLYDSVASDEDLVLAEQQTFLAQQKSKLEESPSVLLSSLPNNANINAAPMSSNPNKQSQSELNAYKEKLLLTRLTETEAQIKELDFSNRKLVIECQTLQHMVKFCLNQNLEMLANLNNPFIGEALNLFETGHGSQQMTSSCRRGRGSLLKKAAARPSSMGELVATIVVDKDNGNTDTTSSKSPGSSASGNSKARKPIAVTATAHEATLRTVELIKELIGAAQNGNIPEMKRTSNAIYEVVDNLIIALIGVGQVNSNDVVMKSLEMLCFHALKLSHEIPFLIEGTNANTAAQPKELVPSVKKLCLAVGAAMKEVVNLLSPPNYPCCGQSKASVPSSSSSADPK